VFARSLSIVGVAIAIVLLSAAVAPVAAADTSDGTTTPATGATLVGAYPNPVADGDPGEFVTVRFEEPTNTSGWTLTDGNTVARLPNGTLGGTVALSTTPADARTHTDHRVEPLSGRLRLANDGDSLELVANGATVSTARYRNAPESERRDFETGTWEPIGATDHDPVRTDGGPATAFVLPDAAGLTSERLGSADERLLVGGYTFTSERVTEALASASADGVDVRLLLDGAPVGGITERQATQLDRLVDAGVAVRLLSGPHGRYQHHHPKYAVIDDRILVSTENFKPAGTGGMSSRGWGVVLDDSAAARELAAIHESDWTWRAATPWRTYREGRSFAESEPATGAFDSRHDPERVDVEAATVLAAPDNAGAELASIVEAADERVLIQQVRIDSRENELLKAALRAADRGTRVRIHLDGTWYVEENNAGLVAWLNRRADAEGWDLEARVDEPSGYEKIHTKGVVADDTAVVGSLNWVRSASAENREVVVALEGPEPAGYYASVFEDDWSVGARRPLPAGLLAAAAVAGSGALLLVRRIEFVGHSETVTDWQW
jgi:phosphatidylserine/phosphatidylglycerophosphate/cardiolipin synthase-like enzyme